MRRLSIIALVLSCAAPALAASSDPDFQTPETKVILELQAAVRSDDKHWFADHLHLPVYFYGKKNHIIRSKDWFLANYATIIGPELKASLLAQDPENFLKNYQGLMVGSGSLNVWLQDFGDPGAGIASDYEIITINNDPDPWSAEKR